MRFVLLLRWIFFLNYSVTKFTHSIFLILFNVLVCILCVAICKKYIKLKIKRHFDRSLFQFVLTQKTKIIQNHVNALHFDGFFRNLYEQNDNIRHFDEFLKKIVFTKKILKEKVVKKILLFVFTKFFFSCKKTLSFKYQFHPVRF